MGINLLLKKEGINEIEKLDTLTINKIAINISEKLCKSFPELTLNQSELFISISRLNMYKATFTDNQSQAKYVYGNNSIYFSKEIDINNLNSLAIHECIHFLQESKNQKGKLLKLGLYDLTTQTGLGINEAAVQYMASIAQNAKPDSVTYYGMTFNSISPDYYPIECALLNQIIYFTGSYPLYTSTLNSNDIFQKTFINIVGKSFYELIVDNFDQLLLKEEEIVTLSSKLLVDEPIDKIRILQEKIQKKKNEITNLFLKLQNLILEKFFQEKFNKIKTEEDLKLFQKDLYNYKDRLVLTTSDTFYNTFYCKMMKNIESKQIQLEKYGQILEKPKTINSLVKVEKTTKKISKLSNILNMIKTFILGEK